MILVARLVLWQLPGLKSRANRITKINKLVEIGLVSFVQFYESNFQYSGFVTF
jgi:hypothetical protein